MMGMSGSLAEEIAKQTCHNRRNDQIRGASAFQRDFLDWELKVTVGNSGS